MRLRLITLSMVAILAANVSADIRRTAGGAPDLSGFYDSGTLTPVDRPEAFGDKQFMTEKEARAIVQRTRSGLAAANRESDPNREAPVKGGDGNNGSGAGGVGGLIMCGGVCLQHVGVGAAHAGAARGPSRECLPTRGLKPRLRA